MGDPKCEVSSFPVVRKAISVGPGEGGIELLPVNFMTMPGAFRTIYIMSGIWQGAGWASIMYTAALSGASQELREAAIMDGANIFQQIKVVEWPAIKDRDHCDVRVQKRSSGRRLFVLDSGRSVQYGH